MFLDKWLDENDLTILSTTSIIMDSMFGCSSKQVNVVLSNKDYDRNKIEPHYMLDSGINVQGTADSFGEALNILLEKIKGKKLIALPVPHTPCKQIVAPTFFMVTTFMHKSTEAYNCVGRL